MLMQLRLDLLLQMTHLALLSGRTIFIVGGRDSSRRCNGWGMLNILLLKQACLLLAFSTLTD